MTSQSSASRYQFRPMSADDLPLLRRWLAMPHVAEWWGAADEQFDLVSGDLDEPAMDQFIVATQEHPFAYLQCYDPAVWPEGGLGVHPQGTRGIDQFIGEAEMVGRGHGSAFIRAFTDDLLGAGTPRIVTDPDPRNARAIRAYEKAGFVKNDLVDTADGIALLMVRNA
jgi:aminoglycoside 6'-N-acetyltransferase